MKGVQCYELFGGIALKNHTFSIFFFKLYRTTNINTLQTCIYKFRQQIKEKHLMLKLTFIEIISGILCDICKHMHSTILLY